MVSNNFFICLRSSAISVGIPTQLRRSPPQSVSRGRQFSRHMGASPITKTEARWQDLTMLAFFTAIISRPTISQMKLRSIVSTWRSGSRNLSVSFTRGIFHTDTGKTGDAAKCQVQRGCCQGGRTLLESLWSPSSFVCGRDHCVSHALGQTQ